MGQFEYNEILIYELGLAPWTPEVEAAYMRMYASFFFGVDSVDNVPADWWEQHREEWMS